MSEPNGWHRAYTKLLDFITEHPEIEIGASRIRIPQSVRTEFYLLFNAVRTAFVEQKFADLLNEARPLSEEYTKVEGEVIKLLELEEISLDTSLYRFLHNPFDALARRVYDLLFDLLKGKIDIDTFEGVSSKELRDSFRRLYRSGYVKWLALSLVKLLEVDKSYQIIPRELDYVEGVLMEATPFEASAPAPEESKRLIFKHESAPVQFIAPDFIVHSTKVDQYYAIKLGLGKALAVAFDTSERREWYSLDSIAAMGSGLTFVYVDKNPEEISLVADRERICRPDLIIECREQKDWYEKEGLEKVKLNHDSLKPTLGTYIISMMPVPEKAYKELMPEQAPDEPTPEVASMEHTPEQVSREPMVEQEQKPAQEQELEKQEVGIHILTVGFDQSKLEPVISALMNQQNKL